MASIAQIRAKYQTSCAGQVAAAAPKRGQARHRVLEDQLASSKRENNDLSRAMYEAAQVQRKLCGPRYFRTGSYEFASEIFPVRHLSGDFITVMQLEDDLIFVIGDIAGKGLMAGMWFTHLVGMVRREISIHGDPASALSAIERDLLLTGVEFPLTTLFLARLNPATGELTYCNAGHPPALLIRNNGEAELLTEGGPVLGAISGAAFVNASAKLTSNSTLLAYSDGIAECRNESGVEFGTERLIAILRTLSACSPSATLFSVLAAVESFAGSEQREDDIALMVLHRFGNCGNV